MNWDNIETITEFDGDVDGAIDISLSSSPQGSGNGTPTTRYTDQKNIGELTAGKPTTSTSLLIESLIQLLCVILEDDRKLSDQSYKAICEQLEKINLIDKSYAIAEFDEMRSQYQMQIYKIIRAVGGHDIPRTLPTVTTSNTKPVETCWSRYYREFDELDFIAGGGFGKVFKARHKLDCIEYAVKQIKINSKTIKLCHLAEVKTIASLNHPNIVQYKAAWLEPFVPDQQSLSMIQSEHDLSVFETNTTQSHASSGSSNNSDIPESKFSLGDGSYDFIQFEHSNEGREETVWSSATKTFNQVLCKYESNSLEESVSEKRNHHALLYIQMSLCQMTLRKWLNERNVCSSLNEYYLGFFQKETDVCHQDIVMDIFCQILAGLHYIHSRNIIHHDIKPSNIFLEMDTDGRLIVQLGDFGLACPLQNEHRGIALGTPLYAAPEQLSGECNSKSDIYSLGIVLIELLIQFGTDMERVRTIEQARKGTLPATLNKKWVKLLQSLLNHERMRPTTKDLTEVLRKINLEQNIRALRLSEADHQVKDAQISDLLIQIASLHEETRQSSQEHEESNQMIRNQDDQIAELKTSLTEKDTEISLLKLQLQQYQNNLSH